MKKIDIFSHILPKKFNEKMLQIDPVGSGINKRARKSFGIVNLEDRFRVMDLFGDYCQIINLARMLLSGLKRRTAGAA